MHTVDPYMYKFYSCLWWLSGSCTSHQVGTVAFFIRVSAHTVDASVTSFKLGSLVAACSNLHV